VEGEGGSEFDDERVDFLAVLSDAFQKVRGEFQGVWREAGLLELAITDELRATEVCDVVVGHVELEEHTEGKDA